MRIEPTIDMLAGLKAQNITWLVADKELVDNALDAGAHVIRISWLDSNSFEIRDNGHGADEDKLRAMLVLGNHHAHKSGGGLGRFGVGAKDALGWMWGRTTITTTHKQIRRKVRLDWERLLESGQWEIEDPEVTAAVGQQPGTIIRVTGHIRRPPTPETCQKIADDLGFTYHPALKAGASITIGLNDREFVVRPFEEPPALNDLRVTVPFRVHGKEARIEAWIVPPEIPNLKFGFSYVHRHRVILPSSNLGCGDYNPSRVFGWVEIIGDDWKLTRHKDAIEEVDREPLAIEVLEITEHLLRRASGMAEHVQLRDIELDLAKALRGQVQQLKERRNPRENNTGPITPAETGKKRKRAAKGTARRG